MHLLLSTEMHHPQPPALHAFQALAIFISKALIRYLMRRCQKRPSPAPPTRMPRVPKTPARLGRSGRAMQTEVENAPRWTDRYLAPRPPTPTRTPVLTVVTPSNINTHPYFPKLFHKGPYWYSEGGYRNIGGLGHHTVASPIVALLCSSHLNLDEELETPAIMRCTRDGP